jgi:hypothetical protein
MYAMGRRQTKTDTRQSPGMASPFRFQSHAGRMMTQTKNAANSLKTVCRVDFLGNSIRK